MKAACLLGFGEWLIPPNENALSSYGWAGLILQRVSWLE